LNVVTADITTLDVDAMVNAAQRPLEVIFCAFNEADAQRYRARLG
jgi:hypothetical protein